MGNDIKDRWYLAYSKLRLVHRQYVRALASACARGEISLDVYARRKRMRRDQTAYFINSALKMKGFYAVIFLEEITAQWQELDNQYGIQ